jgi:hypothetical protein
MDIDRTTGPVMKNHEQSPEDYDTGIENDETQSRSS